MILRHAFRKSMFAALVLATLQPTVANAQNQAAAAVSEFRNQPRYDLPIYIAQPEWTEQFEDLYSQFVAEFGRGVKQYPGRTVKWYMKQPQINRFADRDPADLVHYSDCADFPYFLRNYFAYVYGLPMSVVTGAAVMTRPLASRNTRDGDLATARTENSPYGNYLTSRGLPNIPERQGKERQFINYWSSILDNVSTRTFRSSPLSPGYEAYSDVYPVRIDREGVRPGTIVHSTGHIYVVFDVDAQGTVHMVDAHPDNSVSYKIIKPSTLDRSRPDQGLGFFRFRPSRLSGGKYIGQYIYGSQIVRKTDRELFQEGRYSLEQWFGPDTTYFPGQSIHPDLWTTAFKQINFFDFVQMRLRDANVVTYAQDAVGEVMGSLCEEFKQRVTDVDKATQVGMPRQYHPSELPSNVFSTTGAWEDYSSPSRDGRLRKSATDLPSIAVQKFQQARRGNMGVRYDGSAQDFQRDMLQKLGELDRSCIVTYKNSQGRQVSIGLTELINRLPKMSFDPYHCPERRWGASGQELASCVDQDAGGRWYNAQQSMRNTVGKLDANERLVIRSDRPITLEMLESQRYLDQGPGSQINLGSARSTVVDLRTYFSSQAFLQSLGR